MAKLKTVEASGVKILCAHTRIVATGQLKPHPQNPNTHPDSQIALLAKIIKTQGWRNPIVVSALSGFIIKGHARYAAAKLLNLATVPVDDQVYLTETDEIADMVADNRLAELSEMDRGKLKDILQDLDSGVLDMELTGFTDSDMEMLMTETHQPSIDHGQVSAGDLDAAAANLASISQSTTAAPQQVMCPKCGHEFEIQ